MQISGTLLHHAYLLERTQFLTHSLRLQGFSWRWSKLRSKDNVPESTRYTETILIVHEVVLQMVFLQLPPVRRQGSVVQEVVRQVVADVSKYCSAKHCGGNRPVPVEDKVCEFPEGSSEG